jgi:hypothetical protein
MRQVAQRVALVRRAFVLVRRRAAAGWQGVTRPALALLPQRATTYNSVLREETAREPLAHVVDLARLLPNEGRFSYDEVHFTDPAQRRVADTLLAALTKSGLLP